MSANVNRRQFLGTAAGAAGAGAIIPRMYSQEIPMEWDPALPMICTGRELTVQPVLMYATYERREQTSWRPWGGVLTADAVESEMKQIRGELEALALSAEFPLKVLPLLKVRTAEEAAAVRDGQADVMIIYAASGGALETLVSPKRQNIIFVRHQSGSVYLWYEIAHCRFLRKGEKQFELAQYRYPGGMDVHDVVVDNYGDILMRLRALYGVKNFKGSKIIALGGGGGWCCPPAPDLAREKFNIDIIDVSYDDLKKRIQSARADSRAVREAGQMAQQYIETGGIALNTEKQFVANAFLLYRIFKEYMKENNAAAFTIQGCMGTVIPIAETTACLPLSLLNDEGLLAFCESDFNVIPSGILLHYVSGKPVFLNDPTYPHHGMVTVAHCTAPRRMDGRSYENADILTHFESDYGAAPKVDFRRGQVITMIDPECTQERWIGFRGKVIDSPFLPICRSQCDVTIDGNWEYFLEEMRGFHWMMCYGDYTKEMEYAVRKAGLKYLGIV